MAFSSFTLFLDCVNYYYITQASWGVGDGLVLLSPSFWPGSLRDRYQTIH